MKIIDSTAKMHWTLVGVIAVLGVFAGGAILLLQFSSNTQEWVEISQDQEDVMTVNEEERVQQIQAQQANEKVGVSDWKTYRNDEFGFKFRYPSVYETDGRYDQCKPQQISPNKISLGPNVEVEVVSSGSVDLEEYIQEFREMRSKSPFDWTISSIEDKQIGPEVEGLRGQQIVFKKGNENGIAYLAQKREHIFIVNHIHDSSICRVGTPEFGWISIPFWHLLQTFRVDNAFDFEQTKEVPSWVLSDVIEVEFWNDVDLEKADTLLSIPIRERIDRISPSIPSAHQVGGAKQLRFYFIIELKENTDFEQFVEDLIVEDAVESIQFKYPPAPLP